MTEKNTETPMYLVPERLTDEQETNMRSELLGGPVLGCADMFARMVGIVGTPIPPCADVETISFLPSPPVPVRVVQPTIGTSETVMMSISAIPLVRRTDMEVQVAKVREDAMRQGYLLGFNSATEGWNGEYPFKDKAQSPDEDADWLQDRDDNIRAALKEGEAA